MVGLNHYKGISLICKDALQSGGYFFVHCLRNNLSFWFREPVGQLCLLKMLSKKHIAGFAAGYCVVAFL